MSTQNPEYSNPPNPFQLQIQFSGDKPFQIEFESSQGEQRFNKIQEESKIRSGMFKYLDRIRELTQANIPDRLKNSLPLHFHAFSRLLISPCSDGIVIRYDPQAHQLRDEIFVVPTTQCIAQILPTLSLGFIRVSDHQPENSLDENPTPPPTLGFNVVDASGSTIREAVGPGSIFMQVNFGPPESIQKDGNSESSTHFQTRSRVDVDLDGVEIKEQRDMEHGRAFQVRSSIALPLYWDAISVFPWAQAKTWRESNFRQLAEQHFFETAFQTIKGEYLWLQSNSQVRLREFYKAVIDEFDALLKNADTNEEQLQQFLTRHPEVISPGYRRCIPKQPLGAHTTDFVFEERVGEYLLVELENPARRLFTKSGHEAADLTHARGQIHDWIRYIQDNKSTVERELKLNGISANPRTLIVIGRSNSLSQTNRRKLQVGSDRTEVLTYDDLRDKFSEIVQSFIGLLGHVGKPYAVTYFPTSDDSPGLSSATI
jgi:hypothetical protein